MSDFLIPEKIMKNLFYVDDEFLETIALHFANFHGLKSNMYCIHLIIK